METGSASYRQLLKSSTVAGGGQALNLLIGLARTKVAAILLGPSGVGLLGAYQSIIGLLETFFTFGIRSSAVREIARSSSGLPSIELEAIILTMKRLLLLTGLVGSVVMALCSKMFSIWTFGTSTAWQAIAILSPTILLSTLASSNLAILQGLRMVTHLAKAQVVASLLGTILTVTAFLFLGGEGIIPALLLSALASLLIARVFTVKLAHGRNLPLSDFLPRSKLLLRLGVAFLWTALLASIVNFATRSLIIQRFDIEANGIFQAAWTISGIFIGFVLSAMGSEFYPHLCSLADEPKSMTRLINEQIEIGTLIALPGVAATISFSDQIIWALYSNEFTLAADLLPWFCVGLFGRVVSWPLGFVLLAKGKGTQYMVSESLINAAHVALIWLLIEMFGFIGSSMALTALYAFYFFLYLMIARVQIEFRWTTKTLYIVTCAFALLVFLFSVEMWIPSPYKHLIATPAVGLSLVMCARRLVAVLDRDGAVISFITRIPLMNLVLLK